MTSRLHRTLADGTRYLVYLAGCIHEVETELHTKITDLQGVAYDGDGRRGNDISDPTARAALANTGARHDLDELTRAIDSARAALALAATIASNHRTQDPTKLQRNLRSMIATGDPGCESHVRIGRWVAPTPKLKGRTTVGHRLTEPLWLCGPCYDFVGTRDRLPTKAELSEEQRSGKLRPLDARTGAR